MKALWNLLIAIMLLCPVTGMACGLCTPWEGSTCTILDQCVPSDYYRHFDRSIAFHFTTNPGDTWKTRFREAKAEWTSVAAMTISEETSGGEMEVDFVGLSAASSTVGRTYTSRYVSTGNLVATKIELYTPIKSATTGNPLYWNYGSNPCPVAADEVSLKHVQLHELGHAIGLCIFTAPYSGSVMTDPSDHNCFSTLTENDKLCARFLYQANPVSRCAEFTPVLSGSGVSIKWTTEYEYETSSFVLEKQQPDGSFARISEQIMPGGAAHAGADYEYFDPAGTRSDVYRLMEIDQRGAEVGVAAQRVVLVEPSSKAPIVLSDAERTDLHGDIAAMLEGQKSEEKVLKAPMSGEITWLAICPVAYVDAIAPLVTYRHYHGYNATWATYEYIQSSYGTIKAYLQHLWETQGHALKYVTIVGNNDLIPAELCDDGDVGDFYANYRTDIPAVDLTGDWRPELSVGRIPAATADEVSLYIAKVLEYEVQAAADWNNHLTFFVDDRFSFFGHQSGAVAAAYAEELAELIPPTRTLHYENMLAHLPYDQCSQRSHAIGEFNAGRGTVLAFGGVADYHDLVGWLDTYELYAGCAFAGSQLAQNHKYAFVLGASCDIGKMTASGSPWVLKELLFQRYSGAIACFAPSGATWQSANYDLSAGVLNYLYAYGTPTVGYACYASQKNVMADVLPGKAHTARSYIFYGDPAIKLKGSVTGDAPAVTVTDPNGGEYYSTPGPIEITWTVQDEDLAGIRCTVQITYSGGSIWTTLATGVPVDAYGQGSYNYRIETGTSLYTHCRVQVFARDVCGNEGIDMSDGEFTVQLVTPPPKPGEPIPVDPISSMPTAPKDDYLGAPFPNPFNPVTTIRFGLKAPARVEMAIYDVTGALVKTLATGEVLKAGNFTRRWDGTNNGGASVASGIYFLQMKTESFTKTKRLVLLR